MVASVGNPAWINRAGRWSLGDAISAGTAGVFGAASDDDAELRRNDIKPLGHVFADSMQASATSADQAFRRDDLLDTREMGGKRAAIGGAWLAVSFARWAIGLVFGMDGRDGSLQVLQCETELFRVGLLRFAAEGSLLESGDKLLQPFDPLVLTTLAGLRRDQHRL